MFDFKLPHINLLGWVSEQGKWLDGKPIVGFTIYVNKAGITERGKADIS